MTLFPPLRLSDVREHRASVAALVAANGLPLVGVMFFSWRAFDVVILYWMENVVIGAINVLKMITCWPNPDKVAESLVGKLAPEAAADQEQLDGLADKLGAHGGMAMQASKLFFVPFFTVHYGLFCLVHGVFVCVLLGSDDGPLAGGSPFDIIGDAALSPGLWLAALGLTASHVVSYFTNFLGHGEYRRTAPPLLMMQPYPRIVVLHIAIVLSGFFVVALGQPIAMLVLLVIGKTALDLALHLREHKRPGAEEAIGVES